MGAFRLSVLCYIALFVFAAAPAVAAERFLSDKEYERAKDVYAMIKAGRFSDASEKAESYNMPVLARMAGWMRYRAPDAFKTADDVADALKLYGEWPDRQAMQRRIEYAEGTLDAGVFDILFSAYDPVTPAGKIISYRIDEAKNKGNKDERVRLFREGWREFIGEPGQEAALLKAHGKLITENDLKQKIVYLLERRAYEDADYLIRRIRDKRERGYFKQALAVASGKKDFREVWENLDKKGRHHYLFVPGAVKRDIAANKFDNAYIRFDNMKEADTYFFNTAEWWKLRSRVAREHFDLEEYKKSYDIISRHLFPAAAKEYPEAEWTAGWLALVFLNRPETAARHFKNMSEQVSTPISKGRAFYWLGRAYTEAGNVPGAKYAYKKAAENKATFYGQIAHLHIDDPYLDIPYAIPVTEKDDYNAKSSPFLRAAQIWYDLGQKSLFRTFLFHALIKAETTGERARIVSAPLKVKEVREAVEAARYVYRETGEILTHAAYPLLPDEAQSFSARPEVVHGIILQESRFDLNARSHVGAAGLMQVMPGTAREVARKLGLGGNITKRMYRPMTNVRLGSAYIDTLLEEFGGSRAMALAAYNAGGSRVRDWMRRFGNPLNAGNVKQVINWMEIIPFYETRNYVQRVIENINVYTVLTRRKKLEIKAELFL